MKVESKYEVGQRLYYIYEGRAKAFKVMSIEVGDHETYYLTKQLRLAERYVYESKDAAVAFIIKQRGER